MLYIRGPAVTEDTETNHNYDNPILPAREDDLHTELPAQTNGQEADEALMGSWIKIYQTNSAPKGLGFQLFQ